MVIMILSVNHEIHYKLLAALFHFSLEMKIIIESKKNVTNRPSCVEEDRTKRVEKLNRRRDVIIHTQV